MLALFEEEEDDEDGDVETDSDGPDEIFELFQLIYLQIDRQKGRSLFRERKLYHATAYLVCTTLPMYFSNCV